ncbi:MAG: putative glycoside hydrolase, partial [Rubritalea sp.]|uniref:putative glycoside hydrolase n=1 Tax=Rubritalea sp. TaxID=2109375 RepID=UPI003242A32A
SKTANKAYPAAYLIHTKARKGKKDIVTKYFDVVRQEVQDWWSDAAADAVHKYDCDGIFVDGAVAGHPKGSYAKAFGADKAAVMNKAVFSMLADARRKIGPDKLIVFNPLHGTDGKRPPLGQEQLQVTDGAMIDDFDRNGKARQQSVEYMVNTLEAMRAAAKDGKLILFKGWPDFTMALRKNPELKKRMSLSDLRREARKDILFPLACFLIAAEENCYFCYTWGWEPSQGTLEWYPEFEKPLGPPKGNAVRKGWTFQREFQHASVSVNVETKIAKIDWK